MVTEDVAQRVTKYIQHQGTKSSPALADLVAESHARLLAILRPVTEEQSRTAPAADQWDLRELIRHVIAAQDSVAKLVHHLSRGEQVRRDGPGGIGMQYDDDARPFSAWVAQLEQSNAGMIEAIRGIPAQPDTETKAPHPFFGPLTGPEWAAFQRVHDADHIQHSERILRETATP